MCKLWNSRPEEKCWKMYIGTRLLNRFGASKPDVERICGQTYEDVVMY